MYERFTERARQVIVLACDESRNMHHERIEIDHILLGLLVEPEGLAGVVLREDGMTVQECRDIVQELYHSSEEKPQGQQPFSIEAKKAQELALREALSLGHNYIGTEHVLLGLLRAAPDTLVCHHGLKAERVRAAIIAWLMKQKAERDIEAKRGQTAGELAEDIKAYRTAHDELLKSFDLVKVDARDAERAVCDIEDKFVALERENSELMVEHQKKVEQIVKLTEDVLSKVEVIKLERECREEMTEKRNSLANQLILKNSELNGMGSQLMEVQKDCIHEKKRADGYMDQLEMAWGIIANASDWMLPDGAGVSPPGEWREAAERWRDGYHLALDALPKESIPQPDPTCCSMMAHHLNQWCGIEREKSNCNDKYECADCVVIFESNGDHGIPIHDGGSSYIKINKCPWCGTDL